MNGNGIVTWDDARLTEVGKAQARTIHNAWAKQIENKIPPPESYYVSPLNRCLSTARITFDGLGLPNTIPFQPTVKEVSAGLLCSPLDIGAIIRVYINVCCLRYSC